MLLCLYVFLDTIILVFFSYASLHVFTCTNGLAYLMELVFFDFYLYLFLLLFAVFVRCTVAVYWLVLSVTYSISESLKLVLLEIETHTQITEKGEMKKYTAACGLVRRYIVAGELSHGGQNSFCFIRFSSNFVNYIFYTIYFYLFSFLILCVRVRAAFIFLLFLEKTKGTINLEISS